MERQIQTVVRGRMIREGKCNCFVASLVVVAAAVWRHAHTNEVAMSKRSHNERTSGRTLRHEPTRLENGYRRSSTNSRRTRYSSSRLSDCPVPNPLPTPDLLFQALGAEVLDRPLILELCVAFSDVVRVREVEGCSFRIAGTISR